MTTTIRSAPAPAQTARLGTLPFLGIHYDIARGAYLKPQAFHEVMRLARQAGFNYFLPYLENMIRLSPIAKSCPSCAYTPQQWREFEESAGELGMELVPHFNVIGHTHDICREYPHLAAGPGQIEMDPTQPAVARWLTECLEEFCSFSRSGHFLIGGDEWQAPHRLLADPKVDVGRVWVEQVNRAVAVLHALGRTPIVWHDMLLHYPHVLPLLSRQAVVAFWFYDADSDMPALSLLKAHGFRTIMAGGGLGTWTRRWLTGLDCGAKAALKHGADGFMATHWENCRFERGSQSLRLLRAWLAGREPAPAVLEALSLAESLDKAPAACVEPWRQRALQQLDDPAWSQEPEARDYLRDLVGGRRHELAAGFLRHQYAEGPWHEHLHREPTPPSLAPAAPRTPPPAPGARLDLHVEQHAELGAVLRVTDRRQTLVIYPRFGAPIQDWWVDGHQIIGHPLQENPAARHVPPGGYRSHNGGLRPIWALGTHHNPNALWQGSFDWSVVEQNDSTLSIRLTRSMSHVEAMYDLTLRAGEAGFDLAVHAVNRLPHVHGGFNFNLPLLLRPEDVVHGKLLWQERGEARQTSIPQRGDSAFWIEAPAGITWQGPTWQLEVQADPSQNAGFYIDWQPTMITPDARARYRPLSVGDSVSTRWRFVVTC
jgi:hypothetical protein